MVDGVAPPHQEQAYIFGLTNQGSKRRPGGLPGLQVSGFGRHLVDDGIHWTHILAGVHGF